MKKKGTFGRVWAILSPIVFYIVVSYAVTIAVSAYYYNKAYVIYDSSQTAQIAQYVYDTLMNLSSRISMVSAVICIPYMLVLMRKDRRRLMAARAYHRYEKVSPVLYVVPFILGMAGCIVANNLISLSGLSAITDSYEEIAESLYQGQLIVELVGLGLMVPICEELIFRGVLFDRVKELTKPLYAGIFCAVVFGAFHGNLLQFVYATLLGLLFAYAAQRFHNVTAAIAVHSGANVLSVLLTETSLSWIMESKQYFWVLTVGGMILIVACVYIIERCVDPAEIADDQENPIPSQNE